MINSVFFSIGPLEIRYYSLLMVLGFILGYFILIKFGREKGIEKSVLEDYFFYLTFGLIIGARLFEVLFYDFQYYFSNPIKVFYIWEGGIASHGAMIGAFLVTFWFSKKNKINFYVLSDLVVIPVALAASFIRIGNFINQELVGRVTDSSLGFKFDNYSGLRHPVQLYQSVCNFFNFLILFGIRKYIKLKEGTLTWLFFLFYSSFRFFTEFFKDLPLNYGFFYLGLNLAQWFSLGLILVSIYMLRK